MKTYQLMHGKALFIHFQAPTDEVAALVADLLGNCYAFDVENHQPLQTVLGPVPKWFSGVYSSDGVATLRPQIAAALRSFRESFDGEPNLDRPPSVHPVCLRAYFLADAIGDPA